MVARPLSTYIIGLILVISGIATAITLNQLDQSQDVRSQAANCIGRSKNDCQTTTGCTWTPRIVTCSSLNEAMTGTPKTRHPLFHSSH